MKRQFSVTTHEHYLLRPGMRIQLGEGVAVVVRVNACAAICRVSSKVRHDFVTLGGKRVTFTAKQERLVRISPNAEAPFA